MAKLKTTEKEGTTKIKISHALLRVEFSPCVAAIGQLENIDGADAVFNIVKTRQNIDAAMKTYSEARKKIAEDLAEKGKDGKPLTKRTAQFDPIQQKEVEVEMYVFKSKDVEDEVNRKALQLDEKEISIEVFPIKYDSIRECKGVKPNIILGAREFVILE